MYARRQSELGESNPGKLIRFAVFHTLESDPLGTWGNCTPTTNQVVVSTFVRRRTSVSSGSTSALREPNRYLTCHSTHAAVWSASHLRMDLALPLWGIPDHADTCSAMGISPHPEDPVPFAVAIPLHTSAEAFGVPEPSRRPVPGAEPHVGGRHSPVAITLPLPLLGQDSSQVLVQPRQGRTPLTSHPNRPTAKGRWSAGCGVKEKANSRGFSRRAVPSR